MKEERRGMESRTISPVPPLRHVPGIFCSPVDSKFFESGVSSVLSFFIA